MKNWLLCILGNSIKIIKDFPDELVHAIISDIPYGIGYDDWDVLHDNKNTAHRPLFEPVLWFQKPYKMGGEL